ncbi:hypothetical protein [Elizabethkingia phage TCUEAP1]|nr:hypothetical protein [Elizabethkingia phage TCUEAP1]
MNVSDYVEKVKRGRTYKDALAAIAYEYFCAESENRRQFLEGAYWELKKQMR